MVPVLSSHHDAFSNADFLENVGFIGYVYPYRRLAGIIWESFEELVFVLPRKAIKQVGLHIHYPEVSLKAMTSTLRTLSQKDWGRIQESLDEMEGLTRMMVFFSYHWEDIDLDQVDQLIELDQKWQEVIKEKLPGLHQRGLIRFASSIQHHIHRFKR